MQSRKARIAWKAWLRLKPQAGLVRVIGLFGLEWSACFIWILPSCIVVTLPEILAVTDGVATDWSVWLFGRKGMGSSHHTAFPILADLGTFPLVAGAFTLQVGDGRCWASLRSDKLRGGSAVRGLDGVTVSRTLYTRTLLRVKRDAVSNFSESTEVNWDCLGQIGPDDYPGWGQCEWAQGIEEGFIQCGEDAKEYRSSFKTFQGKWGELTFFLWMLLFVCFVVFAGEEMWWGRKGRGF